MRSCDVCLRDFRTAPPYTIHYSNYLLRRSLQNRVKMGFFKTPPKPPPKKKVKKKKGPKFLTKKMKEKERYEVLTELFEDVDMKKLEAKNKLIVEEKEENRKVGEFAGSTATADVELRVPGLHRLDFMNLTELESLHDEVVSNFNAIAAKKVRRCKTKRQERVPSLLNL